MVIQPTLFFSNPDGLFGYHKRDLVVVFRVVQIRTVQLAISTCRLSVRGNTVLPSWIVYSLANCGLFLPSNLLDHITGAPGAKVRHRRMLRCSAAVCVDVSLCDHVCVCEWSSPAPTIKPVSIPD